MRIENFRFYRLICIVKRIRIILLLLLVSVKIFPVYASQEKAEQVDTVFLEELTVTSMKQGDLQSLPLASTVVSGVETERLGIATVKGISDVVPNFFIPDYGSRMTSSIYVRGIGARIDQPAVGLNVDNVPFFNKDAYDFDLSDIRKVEMLRGPQSTLYGRNTMGGEVNITTLSPMEFQGVRALFEYGKENSIRTSASVYTRPVRNFGLSANIYFTRTDGFFRNLYNGKKTDGENQLSGRLKAEWQISPTFSLINTAAASRLRQGGYPYRYIPTGEINYNDTCFYRRACFNDGLTLSLRLPSLIVSSISSVQYIDDNMTLDQDFLPLPYFTLTQKRSEWVITQDFLVRTSGKRKWEWLSGVFGFYRTSHMQAPVTFFDEGIKQLIENHRNEANPDYPIRWQSRELLLQSHFSNPGYGLAAYHESTLNFNQWHLTAGLRLDFEHTGLSYRSICDSGYEIMHREEGGVLVPYVYIPILIDDVGKLSKDFLQLLPKIAAVYDLPFGNSSNLYASVSKGYKAGGFNTQMFSDVLQQRLMGIMGIGASYKPEDIITYKPEMSWNFEIGSHFSTSDAKLTGELSLFYISVHNQQLTMFPDGTTTGRVMTNAGKTRSFGGEITVNYHPLKWFSAQVAYGYTNAKFTEFYNGKNNYVGKHVPYAPQNTLFVGAVGNVDLPWNWFPTLEIAADVSANGPIYWNEENSVRQNFYAQLGLSATLLNDKFSISLWGKNLTATKFDTFYFVSMGNEFLQNGKPLRFGVTLRMNLPT